LRAVYEPHLKEVDVRAYTTNVVERCATARGDPGVSGSQVRSPCLRVLTLMT
jgi:hypothetical protein